MAKGKGSGFEREISKMLSHWWSGGERDDIFWRSSQSGGRATTRSKAGLRTAGSYGDITALHDSGIPLLRFFCIELKRGYTADIDILDILDSKKAVPQLIGFWRKAEEDRASARSAYSLLIFKRDRKHAVCLISGDCMTILQEYQGDYESTEIHLFPTALGKWLVAVRLDEFLDWLDPATIASIISEVTS